MVRPFRWETDRYGEYSKIGEFVYDHPYQWGSRRTGPDLARAGVLGGPMYKNAAWHYNHFVDPQKMNEQSIMPNYAWFAVKNVNLDKIPSKIRAMQTLGVPYEEGYDQKSVDDYLTQAQLVVDDLKASGIDIEPQKQMVAMIAYMHKLGKDISVPVTEIQNASPEEKKEGIELLRSETDLAEGKKLYDATCVVCHMADGSGLATFPSLIDDEWINGNSPDAVFNSISNGNIAKGMIPYKNQFSEKQIQQLTSYILISLQK